MRVLWLGACCLFLVSAEPLHAAPSAQNPVCDYYVSSTAGSSGNGSWSNPWRDINDHVGDLYPGDTLCVRGDTSGAGRVYSLGEQIYLHSSLVRSGTPGNPITLRSYPGEKVILRNNGDASVVYFKGADYWVVDGFMMDNNAHGRAIRFEAGADHHVLRNNEIYNGRTDGVAICCGINVGNIIENNHIHHFNAGNNDAHGIVLNPGAHETVIRGNTIHDVSGDGVQIYATDDTPIAEYSRNVQIVGNVMYRGALPRSENALDFKGADGLTVAGNELYGYGSSAVVVQKGTRNVLFDGNAIHHSGFGIDMRGEGGKHPENITLRNNVLYDITGRFALAFNAVYNGIAYHNTIVNADGYSFRIEGDGLHGGDLRNNLVYDSGAADIAGGAPFINVNFGYNGWFKSTTEFGAATDITGNGDPGFKDAAQDDFHLTPASRARDAGINVGLGVDYEGDLRPFGSRPDLGADEYWPSLRLSVTPQDHALLVHWTEYDDPALSTFVITYTHGAGGGMADQGPSPIVNIPAGARSYQLTGLPNYVLYTLTIAARTSSGDELIASNTFVAAPTDIFVYLPVTLKNR
jgi:hypothetical protein